MEFLLQISQRIWVDSKGWVRWEGRDSRVREVYVSNPCWLMQRAYELGWHGGHRTHDINYLWSPAFETGQTQKIAS